MKISKIPGLGRFGVFIDDVDFNTITDDEWMEIGRAHLKNLVTIIRNTNMTADQFVEFFNKYGEGRDSNRARILEKYPKGMEWIAHAAMTNDPEMDPEDARNFRNSFKLMHMTSKGQPVARVTGKRDEHGDYLGIFAEGELLWHSNESGRLHFGPEVSLLAVENVIGSATGFVTTPDYYESVSESFRSELDEMIIVHSFTPGRINPGLNAEQDELLHRHMCPEDGVEIPLVIQSPGGIKGLHYSINTIDRVKGMTKKESEQVFETINKELFTEKYIYDHYYQNNSDLLMFDNSITLHRRLGDVKNRLCYRQQHDYSLLQDGPWYPYFQKEYMDRYREEITNIVSRLGLRHFKLPV